MEQKEFFLLPDLQKLLHPWFVYVMSNFNYNYSSEWYENKSIKCIVDFRIQVFCDSVLKVSINLASAVIFITINNEDSTCLLQ